MSKPVTLDLGDFGERIRFDMVDIDSLKVDHSYQRDLTDLVEFIGDNFNPLAYVCALVAEREDNSRYIVDGQQRTKGAKRAGKKKVPAMIFKSKGKQEEAKLFQYLNQFRKPVTVIDIFRASLQAGDPEVVAINDAVHQAGFKVAMRKGVTQWPYISCVEQLRRIYSAAGPEMITDVLHTIDMLWPEEYEALRREAIRGVFLLIKSFGKTLDYDRLKEQMKGNPMASVISRATTEQARERARGNPTHLYQCIFAVLRKIYGKQVPPVDKAWPVEDKKKVPQGE